MRADKFLAKQYGSRTRAAAAISKGLVLKNGKPIGADSDIDESDALEFLTSDMQFVSNGGYKLERGLSVFGEPLSRCVVADFGASTGGFCDCVLRRGAKRVYCVDVGSGQLAPSLASDSRVVVMDETNARYLSKESFPEQIDVVVSDLSFISLRLILPTIAAILPCDGRAFVLFKPQFECDGVGLGKSGILPRGRHAALLDAFYEFAMTSGFGVRGIVNAPIRDKKNIEYVIFLQKHTDSIPKYEFLRNAATLYEERQVDFMRKRLYNI